MQDDETVDEMIRRRRGDARPALLFEDERVDVGRARGRVGDACRGRVRAPGGPGRSTSATSSRTSPSSASGSAPARCAGPTMVGVNPTRRGAELAADIRHTDCQLVVTERKLLGAARRSRPRHRARPRPGRRHRRVRRAAASGTARRRSPTRSVAPDSAALLVFTSGTSGAPKAAIVSQRRLARVRADAERRAGAHRGVGLLPRDADVPLQRALRRLVARGLRRCDDRAAPAVLGVGVPRRRPPLPRHVLQLRGQAAELHPRHAAPPRRPRPHARARRRQRRRPSATSRGSASGSACPSLDNYGSTEGGVTVMRSPPTSRRARSAASPTGVLVVDPETGTPQRAGALRRRPAGSSTPRSASARSSTPGRARSRATTRTTKRSRARTRNGWYWSGDLGYVDADGWLWFAGRDYDWLRVDGENFAAAPVERIVGRVPGRRARRGLRRARRPTSATR